MHRQVDRETMELVQVGAKYAPANIDTLIGVENRFAFERKTNRLPQQLTADMEHYLTYSSLPYTVGACTAVKLTNLWSLDIKPEGETMFLLDKICLPTGNLNARYMILGDGPVKSAVVSQWKRYFERAWSRGAYAQIIREAMKELHINTEVWYTNLLKLQTPGGRASTHEEVEAHRKYLQKELDMIRPDYVICLSRHVQSMFLLHYPQHRDTHVVRINHPCHYAGVTIQESAKAMATDLFSLLL